jgi:hypothetical protein
LADVALDHSDEVHIRALAASALASLNVSDQRIRLRPLVQGDHKDDIDDEIKGSALRALWPSYISVQELLDALTLPKTENLIGAYWGFLHRFEAPPLRTEEAIAVVQWAGTVLKRPSSSAIWFYRTIPRFLKAAWTRIDEASVREAFAEFFVTTYHDDSPLSDDKMNDFAFVYRETELEHRRLFVREILRRAVQADERLGWLALNRPIAFVTPTDLEWLVGELDSAEANIPNRSIIDLIVHLSFARRIDELGFVWSAADRHGALNDALTAAYSVNLSSAVAKWQRDDARSQKRAAQENMLFDINKQISDDLFKIETQNSFDWWRLNLTFFCRTDGRLEPGKEFEANLTKTEGWARTLPELRIRIVRGAYSYLKRNRIRSSPWLGTNTFNRPAAAGYRAFRLLYSEAPELYRRIDHSTWAKWAAAIIGVSFNLNAEEREVRGKIVQQCYELTPSHVRRILDRILRKRSSEVELMDVLELLKRGFDDDLGEFLWKFSAQLAEGDARAGRILCFLVKMKYQAAMQLALDCMAVAAPAPGTPLATLDTLISAVVMLVRTSTRLSWPSFVNTWDRNSEIAVRVLKELAEDWGFRDEPFYSELDEGQLADLFIWSYRNIPPPVDERSGRGRFLTAFDHVEQLRNSILHNLVARSTAASVAAVKRMVESLPDLPWLKWKLIDARRALNAGSWKRLWPPDVISTIASYRPLLPIRSTKAAIKAAAWRIEDAVAASSSRSLTDVRDEIPFSDARPSEPLHWTPRRILAVASEWSSDHGGLSTLNRDLCIALATLGHTVICAVREATEREIADAAAARVLIVVPPDVPAPEGTDPLLFFTRRTLSRLAPEVVLGHDHITGAAAFQISRGILDQVPYVHFVHTLPEEIEPFKSRSGNSYLRGAKKAEDQLKLCSLAQLVVAIGPRIYREVQTRFASSSSVAVAQLRPGLNARLLAHKADPSKLLSRYCLFIARLEDSDVKGAELACRVIYQLSSCWHEPVKPRLIMRGFSSENQIIAIPGFDSAKPYVVARPYSGSLEEIATDIRSSSVMIMPSKREGFGLVGLDGISAGVPILVSSESGLAELLLEQDIVAAIGRTVADSCVADVDGDSGSIAGDWTKRLQKIFSDAQAFAQSERLRAALRPILTWENAAQQLSADIDMIVGT